MAGGTEQVADDRDQESIGTYPNSLQKSFEVIPVSDSRYIAAGAVGLVALLLSGCADDMPTDPGVPAGNGTIRVTVTTSGATPDPDGYLLSISGLADRPVTDGSIDVVDAPAGNRTLALSGLSPNCSVAGDNPRSITVIADQTVSTAFNVSCPGALLGVILFRSDRSGNGEIFSMSPDGSDLRNLTNVPGLDWVGMLAPDGTRVLVDTERDGNREIYVMNADGTGLANLTNRPFSDEAIPFWSPDGTRIVFESGRDGDLEVYAMNADGSGQMNLTNALGSHERFASWAPDGRILFTTDRDGDNEIYVMNADGSNPVNLTNDPAEDFLGVVSPDGTRIAFTRHTGTNTEVFVMNADGTAQTNLTNNGAAADELPDWSPDGTRLVFASTRTSNYEIWVMNADGTGLANLTNTMGAVDAAPRWGP
jgi:TolB protein